MSLQELRHTRAKSARGQPEVGRLAERARIARDLHDTLAQELAGNSMLLQAAAFDFDRRPDLPRTQVRAVVDALGTNLAETRTIIGDLTPPALEHDGLSTTLRTLCARDTATPSRVVFRAEGEPGDLPPRPSRLPAPHRPGPGRASPRRALRGDGRGDGGHHRPAVPRYATGSARRACR
ncbi:sensor histidine kinase [Streptomyces sp. NPDC001658]